ncbi:MAG: SDR family NAD(P)-dependent oxidoreductase [Nitrospiraceae bacterium]
MDLRLTDKVACVTGSSRGIGQAIADAFLREGARVVLTGRNEARLATAATALKDRWGGDRIFVFPGDLTKNGVIQECIEAIQSQWHRLDIVVANLGTGRGKTGWALSFEDWEQLLSANLIAASLMVTHAVPLMRQSGGGSVTFIASIAGLEALRAPIPYASAKAGLIVLSKTLSRELAADQIRVNVVAPGNIWFAEGVWDRKQREDPSGVESYLRLEVPMKRFGNPEEIADTVAFVSSSRASFITGACIVVDGGQSRAW